MSEKTYILYYRPRIGSIYLTDGESCSWGYADKTLGMIMFSKRMHDLSGLEDKYLTFKGTIEELSKEEKILESVKSLLNPLEKALLERTNVSLVETIEED